MTNFSAVVARPTGSSAVSVPGVTADNSYSRNIAQAAAKVAAIVKAYDPIGSYQLNLEQWWLADCCKEVVACCKHVAWIFDAGQHRHFRDEYRNVLHTAFFFDG